MFSIRRHADALLAQHAGPIALDAVVIAARAAGVSTQRFIHTLARRARGPLDIDGAHGRLTIG